MSKIILHVDGDSFFASCEVALNARLKGKPVVVGLERGIACAFTYEAKALGIRRGMPIWEIRKTCPSAIILPGDYESYALFSRRMVNIIKKYTPFVEEYSIDECFADLSEAAANDTPDKLQERIKAIKDDLQRSLGLTFSFGVGSTKVLAKVASKWKKPDGLTVISESEIKTFLKTLPIEKVWGIGMKTSVLLWKKGIKTAYDFISKKREWVEASLSKPYMETWHELQGTSVYKVESGIPEDQKSIAKTGTFHPSSGDKKILLSELSKNAERACAKARKLGLLAKEISFFIKTQEFSYRGMSVALERQTAEPGAIIEAIEKYFLEVYKPQTLYRSTGVILRQLQRGCPQSDLFGQYEKTAHLEEVYEKIDELSDKYGKHSIFLASSLIARKIEEREDKEINEGSLAPLLPGLPQNKRLSILVLREVSS